MLSCTRRQVQAGNESDLLILSLARVHVKLLILKGSLVIKYLTNNSNIKHAQYSFACIRFPGRFSSMRDEKSLTSDQR